MKLTSVYFKAFKSLVNQNLVFTNNCMGLVGVNETGKSNILKGINCLGSDTDLKLADTPKLEQLKYPEIHYKFCIEKDEAKVIVSGIKKWLTEFVPLEHVKIELDPSITLMKTINSNGDNMYYYLFDGISIDSNFFYLKNDYAESETLILHKGEKRTIDNVYIINKDELEENNNSHKSFLEILELRKGIKENLGNEEIIKTLKEQIENNKQASISTDLLDKYDSFYDEIKEKEETINTQVKTLKTLQKQIWKLNQTLNLNADQLVLLQHKKDNIILIQDNISKLKEIIAYNKLEIEDSLISYTEKYTQDISALKYHLDLGVYQDINNFLPKVIFWRNSRNNLLSANTSFDEILALKNDKNISRPLINIFRIGLNIKSLNDLKKTIEEIKHNPNERSRKESRINKKVNKFIKKSWQDYDQELKITLEENQIRIEFFDPRCDDASYFNITERSQGCQTFISFLLTIGAESAQNIISNMVLLLDEPETYLHPSGVRFMLNELIKISKKNNIVLYATHSIFMIDKNNYDRHIIVKKSDEKTRLHPCIKNRIGFFMQEEVLYTALDINLSKDFKSSNTFNFVFEGDGDAILYEYFYNNILSNNEQPFHSSKTSFFQGGKCSDIKKYFTQKPIQLGSKWVFILDADNPANNLKKFITSKYEAYLNKDIFIFQYKNSEKEDLEIELEDMLTPKFMIEVYNKTYNSFKNNHFPSIDFKKFISEKKNYCKYSKEILEELDAEKEFTIKFFITLHKKINNLRRVL